MELLPSSPDHPMTSCTTDSQEGAGRLTSTHPACIGHPHLPLFQGSCFAIPSFIMRVPWSFLEATIWTMLVYWLVSFSPSVSHDGCRVVWSAEPGHTFAGPGRSVHPVNTRLHRKPWLPNFISLTLPHLINPDHLLHPQPPHDRSAS